MDQGGLDRHATAQPPTLDSCSYHGETLERPAGMTAGGDRFHRRQVVRVPGAPTSAALLASAIPGTARLAVTLVSPSSIRRQADLPALAKPLVARGTGRDPTGTRSARPSFRRCRRVAVGVTCVVLPRRTAGQPTRLRPQRRAGTNRHATAAALPWESTSTCTGSGGTAQQGRAGCLRLSGVGARRAVPRTSWLFGAV